MKKTCSIDKEKNKIICDTCKVELDMSYLSKRCPRCNTVLMAAICDKCSKNCTIFED